MANFFARFAKNESGATAIEYALIAGIMATALIAAFGILSPELDAAMTSIGETMQVQQ